MNLCAFKRLKTGDLVIMDKEGYIYMMNRIKEVIKSGKFYFRNYSSLTNFFEKKNCFSKVRLSCFLPSLSRFYEHTRTWRTRVCSASHMTRISFCAYVRGSFRKTKLKRLHSKSFSLWWASRFYNMSSLSTIFPRTRTPK